MDFQQEKVSLTRVDKRLWQYAENMPKRVELAVLDYLKDEGWEGYFSEYFDFDSALLVMMCWKDHSQLPIHNGLASITTANCLFDKASDGYWGEYETYSRHDLIKNFETFDPDEIPKILRIWNERGVKAQFIGRLGNEFRDSTDLSAGELHRYFFACGGKKHFEELIADFFPPERQKVTKLCREAIEYFRSQIDLYKFCDAKLSKEYRNLFDLALQSGEFAGIFKGNDPQGISSWRSKIESSNLADKSILLSLSNSIATYRQQQTEKHEYAKYAPLDLVVWKADSVAAVEVKTPNDRLRPNQKLRLQYDSHNGRTSWVINVSPK